MESAKVKTTNHMRFGHWSKRKKGKNINDTSVSNNVQTLLIFIQHADTRSRNMTRKREKKFMVRIKFDLFLRESLGKNLCYNSYGVRGNNNKKNKKILE